MKKIVNIIKPTTQTVDNKIKNTMVRIIELIKLKHLN